MLAMLLAIVAWGGTAVIDTRLAPKAEAISYHHVQYYCDVAWTVNGHTHCCTIGGGYSYNEAVQCYQYWARNTNPRYYPRLIRIYYK